MADDRDPRWKELSKLQGTAPAPGRGSLLVDLLYNRDLSWLQFNERVAAEAETPTVPLMERLRFAAIVSSNLDEFFMVRVAEIARTAARSAKFLYPDGMNARQLLSQIREQFMMQKDRQARAIREILAALAKAGVDILTSFENERSYDDVIRPRLLAAETMILRSQDPPPDLRSQRIYIFVRFPREYAIINIGRREKRLVEILSEDRQQRVALADRWAVARAKELFPKREVLEAFAFKLLRDAELGYRMEAEESMEKQIIEGITTRPRRAKIIRLEVDAPSYSEGAFFLATQLGLDSAALYRVDIPLDLRVLASLYSSGPDRLRYTPIKPVVPPFLRTGNLFTTLRQGDVLLHHPYDSFDTVVQFLNHAAADPDVTEIYHSLYRTSQASPIIQALETASRNGKKVTVYIELRARFNELANVRWAEELRAAGVRVVRPMGGYKVHSKITRIVRLESGNEHVYTHLGTGNYHPGTARQYTDLGLLTADRTIGAETGEYFQALTKKEKPTGYKDLLVAPGNLHSQFLTLIREETKIQKAGGKGRIIAKMNSLVDPDIITALYDASKAGVQIDLLVRGICCLRPGIGGLSENIRVVSVIDRFLEHSRIYYFRGGGGAGEKLYLSSADWMPRNFYTRYEIAFPVKDAHLKRFIRDVILANGIADNVKAHILGPDGSYERVKSLPDELLVRSQEVFQRLARNFYRGTVLEPRFTEAPKTPAKPTGDPASS